VLVWFVALVGLRAGKALVSWGYKRKRRANRRATARSSAKREKNRGLAKCVETSRRESVVKHAARVIDLIQSALARWPAGNGRLALSTGRDMVQLRPTQAGLPPGTSIRAIVCVWDR
jgi:hypothetical protein